MNTNSRLPYSTEVYLLSSLKYTTISPLLYEIFGLQSVRDRVFPVASSPNLDVREDISSNSLYTPYLVKGSFAERHLT